MYRVPLSPLTHSQTFSLGLSVGASFLERTLRTKARGGLQTSMKRWGLGVPWSPLPTECQGPPH